MSQLAQEEASWVLSELAVDKLLVACFFAGIVGLLNYWRKFCGA
jgi:hypothetical protein